jgi:hypothetical protein
VALECFERFGGGKITRKCRCPSHGFVDGR